MNDDLLLGFAALTGKYLALTRPSTAEEVAAGASPTFGAAGTLSLVKRDGEGLRLVLDWGWECSIGRPGDEWWEIKVYTDEATAAFFGVATPPPGDRVTLTLSESERAMLVTLLEPRKEAGWAAAIIAELETVAPSGFASRRPWRRRDAEEMRSPHGSATPSAPPRKGSSL